MMKIVLGAVSLVGVSVSLAGAQTAGDTALLARGEEVYADRCALCHQDSGEGSPPTFPALTGNDQLRDVAVIVGNVSQGTATMPPFPDLTAEDVAAVSSYIRTAWTNDFGGVSTEEAASVLERLGAADSPSSVWDGVFTEAQADRGQALYPGPCGLCHGRRLNGAPDDPDMPSAPPLARARFIRTWDGRSLATLFEYTRATMPQDNPTSLTDEEYIDVIAYMLEVGGMPPGDDELRPDARSLARIVIGPRPE